MAPPPSRPFRSLFFLSVILIGVGSCGTVSGLVEMQFDPVIPTSTAEGSAESQAQEEANLAVVDAVLRSPYRKPVAAADALVSALLLFAGMSLFRRRKTASWWVTQAALANALLVIVEASTQWLAIDAHWDDILGSDPEVGLAAGNAALSTLLITGLARLALYLWMIWRVRRPDIQAVIAAG